jgi:uncharacterized protein (TIGR02301 family)
MPAALALAVLIAAPQAAPPRSPVEQAQLVALAESLGRAHALHRLCTGAADDLWRSRMGRMLIVERPDPGLRQRLVDGFNAGFGQGAQGLSACTPDARSALQDMELRAAIQARSLAHGGTAPQL